MHSPVEFSLIDSNALGPSLKTFSWDFTINDQHSEGWCDFGEPEATWVQELAEFAVSRKAALAEIRIQLEPDGFWGTTEEMGYPWDRMDRVRDQTLKPNGLNLVYNKPSISKDAWMKFFRTGELGSDTNEPIANDIVRKERSRAANEHEEWSMLESEL